MCRIAFVLGDRSRRRLKWWMETLRGLRYKLRMMGVPIPGPSFVMGDNQSVIFNTFRPESVLRKKSNSICYHAIRESVAMGKILTAHVRSEDNLADLLTKVLFGLQRRLKVVGILDEIYDYDEE